MAAQDKSTLTSLLQGPSQKSLVFEKTDDYLKFFDEANEKKKPDEKVEKSKVMVNNFYDIITDFYEYGWGESFHFTTQRKGESFQQAMEKHELYLAMKLALRPGEKTYDLGCGIGGPARAIAAFSQADIKGINNNDYQIRRAQYLTDKAKLSHLISFEKGDFTNLSIADNSLDKVYAIEATCHAAIKTQAYGEIYRVLKPGARFAAYEWAVTDRFDPNDDEHVKVRDGIREGNALPILDSCKDVQKSLEDVGFEVLEFSDLAVTSEIPWQAPLQPALTNLRATPVGRFVTHSMLVCLEKLRLAPAGSSKAHTMLCKAADDLVRGGELGIFTPILFFLVQKPDQPKSLR